MLPGKHGQMIYEAADMRVQLYQSDMRISSFRMSGLLEASNFCPHSVDSAGSAVSSVKVFSTSRRRGGAIEFYRRSAAFVRSMLDDSCVLFIATRHELFSPEFYCSYFDECMAEERFPVALFVNQERYEYRGTTVLISAGLSFFGLREVELVTFNADMYDTMQLFYHVIEGMLCGKYPQRHGFLISYGNIHVRFHLRSDVLPLSMEGGAENSRERIFLRPIRDIVFDSGVTK